MNIKHNESKLFYSIGVVITDVSYMWVKVIRTYSRPQGLSNTIGRHKKPEDMLDNLVWRTKCASKMHLREGQKRIVVLH